MVQRKKSQPSVEEDAHAIEDMGVSNEAKINRLLATAVTVRKELHESRRKIIIGMAIVSAFLILVGGFAGGVLWGLRGQAERLTSIAEQNKANGEVARKNLEALTAATSPEAQARAAAATSRAVNEIRRSIDCVALYINDERPDACMEVATRMDSIRAGEDPFTQ